MRKVLWKCKNEKNNEACQDLNDKIETVSKRNACNVDRSEAIFFIVAVTNECMCAN